MKLYELFEKAPDIEIDCLSLDSRNKMTNGLFFCMPGLETDGHLFIEEAIQNGAVAICYTQEISDKKNAVFIRVNEIHKTLARVAATFYNNPSEKLALIGITGTKSKTSVALILKDLLDSDAKCGYIGTLGISCGEKVVNHNLELPSIIDNNNYLNQMISNNCYSCAMEVSSLSIDQNRVEGLDFNIAAFTNFSFDDAYYHGNIEDYFKIKKSFFDELPINSLAITNIDDEYGLKIIKDCKAKIVTYGIEHEADYLAYDIKIMSDGTSFTLNAKGKIYRILTNLLAEFNVYNLLCVLAIVGEIGYDLELFLKKLQNIKKIDGRMNYIKEDQNFNCIIDFAEDKDSLIEVLEFAKGITSVENRIIVVFGTAGNRNANKRKIYGEIVDEYADLIIITENDARDETVENIAKEIESGIKNNNNLVIEDRKEAINMAISMMNKGDSLLILGKGNDKFIERLGGKEYYEGDDYIAKEAIRSNFID